MSDDRLIPLPIDLGAAREACALWLSRIQIGAPLVGSPDGVLQTDDDARQFFGTIDAMLERLEAVDDVLLHQHRRILDLEKLCDLLKSQLVEEPEDS